MVLLASGNKRHYETTLERVRDYYGSVLDIERFKRAVDNMDKLRIGEVDIQNAPGAFKAFVEEFNLLDPSYIHCLTDSIRSISTCISDPD